MPQKIKNKMHIYANFERLLKVKILDSSFCYFCSSLIVYIGGNEYFIKMYYNIYI